MKVIGLCGQLQNGKDTVGNRLLEKLGNHWKKAAFAYEVKKIYCDTFGVDADFVEKWKVINDNPPNFQMSVRKGLQFIGDGFRQIRSSIWLDLAFKDDSPKIFFDERYLNEADRIKKEGGINILIVKPDRVNDDPNGSESQIKPYVQWLLKNFSDQKFVILKDIEPVSFGDFNIVDPQSRFDIFIHNNGTINELYDTVDNKLVPYILEKFGE
jgi:hypothetical protein